MNRKKSLIFVTAFLGIISTCLGGCHNDDPVLPSKSKLDFGYIRSTPLDSILNQDELEYNSLKKMMDNKRNFVLAIYGDNSCGCWINFHPILTQYMNENNMKVEYMHYSAFNDKDNLGFYIERGDMPSFSVVANGQIIKQVVYGRDGGKLFHNYKNFVSFMNEYVVPSEMMYVDKDILQTYMDGGKDFNLYVAKTGCPDCGNVEKDYLIDWNQKNTISEPLYVFDISPYDIKGQETEYLNLKKWLGLTQDEHGVPTLGYGNGVVPTFQRRHGSEVTDMISVNNDKMEEIDGVKYAKSYFTPARVAAMPFLKNAEIKTNLDGMEVGNYVTYNEKYGFWDLLPFYQAFHYPIIKLFFSTYVK